MKPSWSCSGRVVHVSFSTACPSNLRAALISTPAVTTSCRASPATAAPSGTPFAKKASRARADGSRLKINDRQPHRRPHRLETQHRASEVAVGCVPAIPAWASASLRRRCHIHGCVNPSRQSTGTRTVVASFSPGHGASPSGSIRSLFGIAGGSFSSNWVNARISTAARFARPSANPSIPPIKVSASSMLSGLLSPSSLPPSITSRVYSTAPSVNISHRSELKSCCDISRRRVGAPTSSHNRSAVPPLPHRRNDASSRLNFLSFTTSNASWIAFPHGVLAREGCISRAEMTPRSPATVASATARLGGDPLDTGLDKPGEALRSLSLSMVSVDVSLDTAASATCATALAPMNGRAACRSSQTPRHAWRKVGRLAEGERDDERAASARPHACKISKFGEKWEKMRGICCSQSKQLQGKESSASGEFKLYSLSPVSLRRYVSSFPLQALYTKSFSVWLELNLWTKTSRIIILFSHTVLK